MGYKPGGSIYGLYQELGALSGIRIIEMSGYGGYFDEVQGLTIMVTKDLDRLGDDLKVLFPQDVGIIEDLISGSKKMAGGQLGIIEDGCESFVQAIERRYKELKGDLQYNARVVEILVGTQAADTLIVRIFNYAPRFAPPGKTVSQASFETDWDYWNDLSKDRAAYEAMKQRVASEILDRLSRYYPGIKDQIEMTDVATPYTTWRYTLNHRGAPEGFQPTPQTIMAAVPRTLPGLGNFYMAGQWVMPGGGVPPCLFSGRHAIQLICHQEKQRFVTSSGK